MALVPVQDLRMEVYGAGESWVDTGITLVAGDTLFIEAFGTVRYASNGTSTPEGTYPVVTEPNGDSRLHAPWGVPLGLVFCIRPYGVTPGTGAGAVTDPLDLDWSDHAVTLEDPGAGRLWAIFNDLVGQHGDNSGKFNVHLVRQAEEDVQPFPLGQVSPIHLIPSGLLTILQQPVQPITTCWYIKPLAGPAEFYTDWDASVACPEYIDATGLDDEGGALTSTTPAGTYLPFRGAAITNVPHAQGLSVEAPDVTVVNFEANKLRNGFYQDAHVEIFEVALFGDRSERNLLFVGTFGNVDYDDLGATIELTPFEQCLNQPQGQTIGPLCDVGRIPGETFGRGRCRNQAALDGPAIADWSRGAELDSLQSLSRLVFTPATVSGFTGFESDFPGSFGLLKGVTGDNAGITREVKTFNASTGVMDLRRALPTLPAVGDTFVLEAGCDKSIDGAQGCVFWDNVVNFRGFPFVPGRRKVRSQYRA